MQHHKSIGIGIVGFVFIIPLIAFGAGTSSFLSRPFGGRVLDTGAAGNLLITCTSTYGPITMHPYVLGNLPGPYFIRSGKSGSPRTGGFILGLYSQTPDTRTCYNTETGAPVPAYEIKTYGVSR